MKLNLPARARRFCWLGLACLFACGGEGTDRASTPTAPPAPPNPAPESCIALSGAWTAAWSMTPCGFATGGEAAVTVEQDGCAIRFTIPRLGRFAGNVADRRSDGPLALEFDPEAPGNGPACDPSSAAALDATDPERVLIPFGASPAPCCQHGMVRLSR